MKIKVYSTGGTIDKVYFDVNSDFQVGEPGIIELLQESFIQLDYQIESILKKDSLDLTSQDRRLIRSKVLNDPCDRIIVTHGTDTMVQSARFLFEKTEDENKIQRKTIVLTGAMQPAKQRSSDAAFNIGCAVMAVQLLQAGVYIAMHGRVFDPRRTKKNKHKNCFEELPVKDRGTKPKK